MTTIVLDIDRYGTGTVKVYGEKQPTAKDVIILWPISNGNWKLSNTRQDVRVYPNSSGDFKAQGETKIDASEGGVGDLKVEVKIVGDSYSNPLQTAHAEKKFAP
jgi:hypothetical protein